MRAPVARSVIAKVTCCPTAKLTSCVLIHSSAVAWSYGCGMLSVFTATSRSPARRSTSGASVSMNGRSVRRSVSSVGRSFTAPLASLGALHAHVSGERGPDVALGALRIRAHAHGDRSTVRRTLDQHHRRTRPQPELAQIAKPRRVVVAHAHDTSVLAWLEIGERDVRLLVDLPLARGDRRAVRIDRRLADRRRHAIDELVRCRMLQPLGLVVHEIPRVAERAREVRLDHAMAANRAERHASPFFRELHAAIALVLEQALIGEATHHPAHRCGRDLEPLRDVGGRGRAARALDLVDHLEVVLDRRGVRFGGTRLHHDSARSVCAPGCPRTISTGTVERCRTAVATLPRTRSLKKRCPCVAMAMRSHCSRSAASVISRAGSPLASTASTWNPSDASVAATFSRYSRSRRISSDS